MTCAADTEMAPRPLRRTAWRVELRPVAHVVAAYAVIRVLHLLMLWAANHGASSPVYQKLLAWDGGWYIKLAVNGYPDHLELSSPSEDDTAPLAFPPLYPMAMRGLHLIGVPPDVSGLAITFVAGLVAVVGVYAVAREVLAPRAAFVAAVLWSAGPMTIVLSMAYSEALFVALAAWAVLALMRQHWLTAGVLALLAGLTRTTGLAVAAAVIVCAAWSMWQARKVQWRPLVASVVAAVGVPIWWLIVALIAGRADAWFAAQEFFWGSRFDFGADFTRALWDSVTLGGEGSPLSRTVYFVAVLTMLAGVVLAVWLARQALRRTTWLPLAVYAVTLLVLAIGSAGFLQSKIRFFVPMFVLLLLPASALAKTTALARWTLLSAVVLVSGWWSAFMLTVWPFAI